MCLHVQAYVHMTFLCVCVCSWLQFTLSYLLHLCEIKGAQTHTGALASFPTVIGAICFGYVESVSGMLLSIISRPPSLLWTRAANVTLSEPNWPGDKLFLNHGISIQDLYHEWDALGVIACFPRTNLFFPSPPTAFTLILWSLSVSASSF